jgi:hypothetical protein
MPVKRYNGSSWEVIAGDGVVGAPGTNGTNGTNGIDASPYSAGKNKVINGGMNIWQRGTSMAGTTTGFSADRWQSYRGVAGSTFSRQTGPEGIQYCIRVQRDSGNTSTSAITLFQNFETANSIPLAGKTVTLSFYARAGANYSRAGSNLQVQLITGTGVDQNGPVSGYTGSSTRINELATLTTSWQRFTYSATLLSSATEMAIVFNFVPVGTAGADDYYEITGVQLEASSVATEFATATGTIQGELAACQRYFRRISAAGGASLLVAPSAVTANASQAGAGIILTTSMRTTPTLSVSAVGHFSLSDGGTAFTSTAISIATGQSSPDTIFLNVSNSGGMTQYRAFRLEANTTSATMDFNAEL